MAEANVRLTDTESSSSDRIYVINYGLAFDEIREKEIQEEGQDRKRQRKDKTDAFCNVCLMQNLIALRKIVAFYLCYVCEKYLCEKCFKGHESHNYIKLVSEKSEREPRSREFLGEMRKERKREKKFERENVSMVDRVNVKHGLDHMDCLITGLCGLDNTRWVLCDYNNSCIKLFNVGSNLLQRYIQLGSKPWDVTEIKVKSAPTEQGIMSMSDISVTNRVKLDKQCLLAVTLPWKRRLLIIDVTHNPAVITKSIETEKQCYPIDFNGDYICTLCSDDGSCPWFVFVMSTDGVKIKTINCDLHDLYHPYYPYLAVCSVRFYITDPINDKVHCLKDEGKVVSHRTIEVSLPYGISVDPDTNQVYVSARNHHKLYRLDSSLESLETLFDFKSVNSNRHKALCVYRDKLYVGHDPWSTTHQNSVTVIRVL